MADGASSLVFFKSPLWIDHLAFCVYVQLAGFSPGRLWIYIFAPVKRICAPARLGNAIDAIGIVILGVRNIVI